MMNNALAQLKTVGKYQWFAIFTFSCGFCVWNSGLAAIPIFAANVPHHCTTDSGIFKNLTFQEQANFLGSEHCLLPDLSYENFSTTEELVATNLTGISWIRCENYVFDHMEFDYTFTEQYRLICEGKWLKLTAQSVYFVGMLVSALVSGFLPFGRKNVLVILQILGGLFYVIQAFVSTTEGFLIMRLLTGFTDIASMIFGFILVLELLRKEERIIPPVFGWMSYCLGMVGFTLLSYFIRDHRYLQILVACGYFVTAALTFFLFESTRWLQCQNRTTEVMQIIEKMSEFNQVPTMEFQHLMPKESCCSKESVFRIASYRWRLMVLSLVWFSIIFHYIAFLMSHEFSKNVRVDLVANMALRLPALLIFILTINRFGRQVSLFICIFVSTIFCIILAFLVVHSPESPFRLIFTSLGIIFTTNAVMVAFLLTIEMHTTSVRATCLGFCLAVANVARIIAPHVTMLNYFWEPIFVVISTLIGVVALVLIPFLPDTSTKELPNNFDNDSISTRKYYRLILPKSDLNDAENDENLSIVEEEVKFDIDEDVKFDIDSHSEDDDFEGENDEKVKGQEEKEEDDESESEEEIFVLPELPTKPKVLPRSISYVAPRTSLALNAEGTRRLDYHPTKRNSIQSESINMTMDSLSGKRNSIQMLGSPNLGHSKLLRKMSKLDMIR